MTGAPPPPSLRAPSCHPFPVLHFSMYSVSSLTNDSMSVSANFGYRGSIVSKTTNSEKRLPSRALRAGISASSSARPMATPHAMRAPKNTMNDAAAHYYRDTLGFSFNRFWGDPPSFCMVTRGGVVIMLAQIETSALVRPNNLVDREGGDWDAYVGVPNADALHAEVAAKGATIARGLSDQECGCRDFDVLDCNGYRLCFGQDLA